MHQLEARKTAFLLNVSNGLLRATRIRDGDVRDDELNGIDYQLTE